MRVNDILVNEKIDFNILNFIGYVKENYFLIVWFEGVIFVCYIIIICFIILFN